MCTHETARVPVSGSGKGPDGWITLADASVYYDHPYHTEAEHSLNVDFFSRNDGPPVRIALELERESARMLAHAILAFVDSSER